jgi:hypothetical protein
VASLFPRDAQLNLPVGSQNIVDIASVKTDH